MTKPLGPYTPVVRAGDWIIVSGQLGMQDGALVSDLLKLLLKIRAKETGVAARLIARSDDLEALAAGVRKNLNILRGWRYDQFGKDALDLVEGRLAFAIEHGKLKMSRVVQEETVDA